MQESTDVANAPKVAKAKVKNTDFMADIIEQPVNRKLFGGIVHYGRAESQTKVGDGHHLCSFV